MPPSLPSAYDVNLYLCMSVSAGAYVSQCTSRAQRAILDSGPCLPPCFKQDLLVGLPLCKQVSFQGLACLHLPFYCWSMGLQTCTTPSVFMWILKSRTQVLKLLPTESSPSQPVCLSFSLALRNQARVYVHTRQTFHH